MLDIQYPTVNTIMMIHHYSVFMSVSGEGAQAWTSPSSSQHLGSEEEPITYGNLPISLEDDPEPQI